MTPPIFIEFSTSHVPPRRRSSFEIVDGEQGSNTTLESTVKEGGDDLEFQKESNTSGNTTVQRTSRASLHKYNSKDGILTASSSREPNSPETKL